MFLPTVCLYLFYFSSRRAGSVCCRERGDLASQTDLGPRCLDASHAKEAYVSTAAVQARWLISDCRQQVMDAQHSGRARLSVGGARCLFRTDTARHGRACQFRVRAAIKVDDSAHADANPHV